MMGRRHLWLLVFVLLSSFAAGRTWAECVATSDTYDEILEVRVRQCSDPAELIRERAAELGQELWFTSWLASNTLGIRDSGGYIAWIQTNESGLLLDVTVVRSRRLIHAEQARTPRGRPWQLPESSETLVFLGPQDLSCNAFETGKQQMLFIRDACCDTVPPSDLPCLFQLRPAIALPQWVRDAGLAEVD